MAKKIILGLLTIFVLFSAFSVLACPVYAQEIPKKARILKGAGDIFFNQGDYQKAIDVYARAIVIADNYPDAHFWKGYSHYKISQIKQNQNDESYQSELNLALDELNAAYLRGYKPLDVYKTRWYVNYAKNDFDAALEDLKNGLRIDPANLALKAGLADVYYTKRDYREAVDAYVRVVDQIPNKGNVYFKIANSHYNLGNTAAQKIAAEKAIANKTTYIGESYFLIGDAFQNERNLNVAADAFKKALNTLQDKKFVYQRLSAVYRAQNRFEDAIEIIKRGLKAFPDDGELYVDLSWYFSLADRHKEAVGAAQKAIAIKPDVFMAHTNLCLGYNGLNEFDLAIQACNTALRLNPGHGETNFYLGRAYAGLNDKSKATQFIELSITGLLEMAKERPNDTDVFYLLGNAYDETNQNTKAIEAYEQSLVLSPEFTKALYKLGVAYFVGKNLEKAKIQHTKLLTLDPEAAKRLANVLDGKLTN